VNGCAVSRDGQWIVSASWDKTLKVWDAASGAEKLILTGYAFWVNDCALSPDGQWVASTSSDGTLKMWDAVDRRHKMMGDWTDARGIRAASGLSLAGRAGCIG
jgi:WD40 repeat protein